MKHQFPLQRAFTLIELLVVIAIIAVLMGLLFPAAGGAIDAAKKAQAKNDVVGICNAVRAYNTEYGSFPLVTGATDPEIKSTNNGLMKVLLGLDDTENPKKIVFMEIPPGKKAGAKTTNGLDDQSNFRDPYGEEYWIKYDGDYDNTITTWAGGGATAKAVRTLVIAKSKGKDLTDNTKDDVNSWQ